MFYLKLFWMKNSIVFMVAVCDIFVKNALNQFFGVNYLVAWFAK